MKKKNNLPERWLAYKNIGEPIAGTRFVSLKVPLSERFSFKLRTTDRFSPTQLLQMRPNLRLVIDLTNTDRYYTPELFERNEVKYCKVACPGKVIPSERIVHRFFNVVNEYLRNDPPEDFLIGVHCTHGVNRTGFMVCSYLIRQLLMPPREAISAFEAARGHAIERKEYVDALMKLKPAGFIKYGQLFGDDSFEEEEEEEEEEAGSSSGVSHVPNRSGRGRRSYGQRNRNRESAGDRWAYESRSAADPWAPAPGPEANPSPGTSESASTSWSSAPGPVAGPSRKNSYDQLIPGYNGGPARKKVDARYRKGQSRSTTRLNTDETNEQPWRSFSADQGSSHQEHLSAASSSDPSRYQHPRGRHPARGYSRQKDGRSTPSHLAPPPHLPRLPPPPPQSSRSLPSFAGPGRGSWRQNRHQHERACEPGIRVSPDRRRGHGHGQGQGQSRGKGKGEGGSWGSARRGGRGWAGAPHKPLAARGLRGAESGSHIAENGPQIAEDRMPVTRSGPWTVEPLRLAPSWQRK